MAGGLGALENWLYDHRALYFQHFTPPPTDRLVHLDIDDAALETIGRWPWPRSTLADIVDEVRLAGADVLALDVIFREPQAPTTRPMVDGKAGHGRPRRRARSRVRAVSGGCWCRCPSGTCPSAASTSPVARGGRRSVARRPDAWSSPAVAARLPAGSRAADRRRRSSPPGARRWRGGSPRSSRATARAAADEVRRRMLARSIGRRRTARRRSRGSSTRSSGRRNRCARRGGSRRARPADCPPLLTGSDPQLLPAFARVTRYTRVRQRQAVRRREGAGVPLWVEHEGCCTRSSTWRCACAVLGADLRLARASIATASPCRCRTGGR